MPTSYYEVYTLKMLRKVETFAPVMPMTAYVQTVQQPLHKMLDRALILWINGLNQKLVIKVSESNLVESVVDISNRNIGV